ncbi:MFS transporter [Clostridium sp. OS1-26]|uniref:MFS transporter n=1 Tax=Clostridium sp. OS1-26 TaxID=3070681 RepID=UPI0027E1B3E6|nr:MFS transporter [Clostridium sp. OS1-26]WML37489.1 MFS transporter [Clostridium sp. OS1-26]
MKKNIFSRKELLFLITISLALGIRQMAMTMVMPFISTYSKTLSYSTPTLAGTALGIFGLTQAIFQIPFGIWSDKIGNKSVLLVGIMQVIIGLVIAFLATNIYMLIFSRALQGSGAVIAVGYSWITGSVDNKKRARALSIVGIVIGFAAAASFALGPLIHKYLSVRQMFLVCAILIFLVWIIILFFLKETNDSDSCMISKQELSIKDSIRILLKNRVFLGLNLAGFFNNFIMVSVFYAVPQYLEKITGINSMWKIFMPAVIIAIICMRKAVKFVEAGYSSKLIAVSFIINAIGICFYFNKNSFYFILVGSILFMIGYISLSTIIPSVANDIAEDSYRGTANGIINSFQYIGSFIGAVITGALWNNYENIALFLIILISIMGIFTVKNKTNSQNE